MRAEYYRRMRLLAQEQRTLFNLTSATVSLTEIRSIYKHYGVSITLWPPPGMNKAKPKKLRGSYHHIDGEPTVLVDRKLPKEQRVITMAHELKHHLEDFETVKAGASACHITEENNYIEIGAEIFAVELIYPDDNFVADIENLGVVIGECNAGHIVRLKEETGTALSYASLAKRAEFLGYATAGSLPKTGWIKLHEAIYGEPDYKRIQRYRAAKQRAF
jgi:hypothetical protein